MIKKFFLSKDFFSTRGWLLFAFFLFLAPRVDSAVGQSPSSPTLLHLGKGVAAQPSDPNPYVPGELIIKFKPSSSPVLDRATVISYNQIQSPQGSAIPQAASAPLSTNSPTINALNDQFGLIAIDVAIQRLPDINAIKGQFPARANRAPAQYSFPDLSQIYEFTFDVSRDMESLAAEYRQDPAVEYATPRYIPRLNFLPNDTYVDPDQDGTWSQGAWGQLYEDMWGLRIIEADKAWDKFSDKTKIGEGLVIAVVDTGLDYNHVDILGNVWSNDDIPGNSIDDDGNGYIDDFNGIDLVNGRWSGHLWANDADGPMDGNGHGSHVSGTIAAAGHNQKGIAGIVWRAKIMPIQSFDKYGYGSGGEPEAILYAAENGADIINNSWGFTSRLPSYPYLEDVIKDAYGVGCAVIFSAGNKSDDARYYSPQNMGETITVGASSVGNRLAYFSNYGNVVDVAAPGGEDGTWDILSLQSKELFLDPTLKVADKYLRLAGTSMAAPHVSGLVALLLSYVEGTQKSIVRIEEVRAILKGSSDPVTTNKPLGGGRINAWKAINHVFPKVVARLTAPNPGLPVRGSIDFSGVASWETTGFYSVYYYLEGADPATRQQIGPVQNTVRNNERLLPVSWDTTSIQDGNYVILLEVTGDGGKKASDTLLITVDNVYITDPVNNILKGKGTVFEIKGSVDQKNFDRYEIYFNSRRTEGISLEGNGRFPIKDGLLGKWDSAQIPEARGRFEFRLVVYRKDGTSDDSTRWSVQIDDRIRKNFPVYKHFGNITVPFVIGDIDSSIPGKEIVFGASGTFNGVREGIWGLDMNGNRLWNYDSTLSGVAMADLFPEIPGEEIVVTDDKRIFVLNGKGQRIGLLSFEGNSYSAPVIADVQGDNNLEIVIVDSGAHLFVLDKNLKIIWDYDFSPVDSSAGKFRNAHPSVADLDPSPGHEIVIPWVDGKIYVFNAAAKKVVWEYSLGPKPLIASAALGDLDGNGTVEIVLGDGENNVKVIDYSAKSVVWSYPVEFGASKPVLADLNQDFVIDILVTGRNYLYALDFRNKSVLWQVPSGAANLIDDYAFPPPVGDIDRDGKLDVVNIENPEWGDFAIIQNDGSKKRELNLDRLYLRLVSPIFGAFEDLDGDGKLELVTLSSGDIAVFDLKTFYDPHNMPWPAAEHDYRRTGAFTWPPVQISFGSDNDVVSKGEFITLSWNAINATACAGSNNPIGGEWPGPKSASGSVRIQMNHSTFFNLKCSNPETTVNRQVDVMVNGTSFPPPIISDVQVGEILTDRALVTWKTDVAANTQVEFGTTTSYGNETPLNPAMVTSHSAALDHLTADTLYHFRVKSKNFAGGLAVGRDGTFRTATSPSADLTVSILGVDTAGVLKVGSPVVVRYLGTNQGSAGAGNFVVRLYVNGQYAGSEEFFPGTLSYKQITWNPPGHDCLASDGALCWVPSASGKYNLQVKIDSAGENSVDCNQAGSNVPEGESGELNNCSAIFPIEIPPANLTVEPRGPWPASIGAGEIKSFPYAVKNTGGERGGYFETRMYVNGSVAGPAEFYSNYLSPGDELLPQPNATCPGNAANNSDRVFCWTAPNQPGTYKIRLKVDSGQASSLNCADGAGGSVNEAGNEHDNCTVEHAVVVEVRDDSFPPEITNVVALNVGTNGAVISWMTDEPSNSQVEYGVTTSYGKLTPENTAMVTEHSVGLSLLLSNTVYHYRVKSRDAAGNPAISGDYTFKTGIISQE